MCTLQCSRLVGLGLFLTADSYSTLTSYSYTHALCYLQQRILATKDLCLLRVVTLPSIHSSAERNPQHLHMHLHHTNQSDMCTHTSSHIHYHISLSFPIISHNKARIQTSIDSPRSLTTIPAPARARHGSSAPPPPRRGTVPGLGLLLASILLPEGHTVELQIYSPLHHMSL